MSLVRCAVLWCFCFFPQLFLGNPVWSGTSKKKKNTLQLCLAVCKSYLVYLEKAILLASFRECKHLASETHKQKYSNQIFVDFGAHSIKSHVCTCGPRQELERIRKQGLYKVLSSQQLLSFAKTQSRASDFTADL